VKTSGAVCAERFYLLKVWTKLLSAQVKLAVELYLVSENTHDFARHKVLLEQAWLLHEQACFAQQAYCEHCAQHDCVPANLTGSRRSLHDAGLSEAGAE
jgi:hypothetical protein